MILDARVSMPSRVSSPKTKRRCEVARVAGSRRESGYRIGEVSVILRSDLPSVMEEFDALYGKCPSPPMSAGCIRMDVRLEARRRLRRREYRVYGDGEPVGPVVTEGGVLPYVEWGINYRIAERLKDFLLFHAAAVGCGNTGVLFPADSGSGKSTLAAGLFGAGWDYFSDECAFVDPMSLRVHAFPKAMCIKAGSFDVVERVGLEFTGERHYINGGKGEVGYISPFARDGYAAPEPVSVGFVIIPQYVPGRKPRLRRITRVEGAFALVRSAMNRGAFGSRAVETCTRITDRAECYVLDVGRLDATRFLLDSLVGERRGSTARGFSNNDRKSFL